MTYDPDKAEPKTERLELRVTPDERAEWEKAAKLAGIPLGTWMRRAARAQVRRCSLCGRR